MKPLTRVIAFTLALLALYGCYCLAGYRYFYSESCLALVDYSLYPEDIPRRWMAMPSPSVFIHHALFSRDPQQIRKDFARLKLTLYSGAIGYRDAFSKVSDIRTTRQEASVREIARFFMKSGIDTSAAWVDEVGCTAVHQALILHDRDGAQTLVTLGKVDPGLSNETAKASDCRLAVSELASKTHISVIFGR